MSLSPLGCPYDFKAESGDEKIVVVGRWNQSVDIRGRGDGTATVTVTSITDPAIKTKITVKVGNAPDPTPPPDPDPKPVTGVSLNKDTLELEAGETEQLAASVEPADAANKNVTWESDDPDIATVDQSGNVLAIAAGTATVTVTTEDGGFTAECEVTVTGI